MHLGEDAFPVRLYILRQCRRSDETARLLLAGAHGITADPAQPVSVEEHRRLLDVLVRVVVDGLRAR